MSVLVISRWSCRGPTFDLRRCDKYLITSITPMCNLWQIIPGSPATEGSQIGPGDALIDVDGYDVVGRPVRTDSPEDHTDPTPSHRSPLI